MRRGLPRAAGLVTFAALSIVGCADSSSPTDTGPTTVTITGVAVTAPASSLKATETLQLTAAVQPGEASQAVTWSSFDPSVATVDASGLVSGLHTGPVTIQATSVADPTKSGTVVLGVECPTPREVTSNIDEDATWENWVDDSTCLDYVVRTSLELTKAVLTIENHTAVGFDPGVYLMIHGDDAGLTAIGSSGTADTWILTGTTFYPEVGYGLDVAEEEAARGWWGGIYFNHSRNPNNHLADGLIKYAGDADFHLIQPAAVMIDGSSRVRIHGVEMLGSSAYGMFIQRGAEMPESGNNVLGNNTLGPAYVDASVAHYLGADNSKLINNGHLGDYAHDWVMVEPDEVTDDVTWATVTDHVDFEGSEREADQPGGYRILPGGDLQITGHLTLEPGVHIEFSQGEEMLVKGSLNAEGDDRDGIVFSGAEKVRGTWGGIRFEDTAAPENVLDHVTIEYGGGPPPSGSQKPADLLVTHGSTTLRSRVSVSASVLRESAGYGLWVRGEDEVAAFTGNTLTANTLGPAYVDPKAVGGFLDDNVFTGNDVDMVSVSHGTVVADATWRDQGVPFRVLAGAPNELAVDEGAVLRLEPGVDLRFGPGMGVAVRGNAFLAALGTADHPVTLHGDDTQWRGIQVHDSRAYFDHTAIDDAGSEKWGGSEPGAVTINTSNGGLSKVTFTADVTSVGAPYGTVFTSGSAYGLGCLSPVYVPTSQVVSDHCNASGLVEPPAATPRSRWR